MLVRAGQTTAYKLGCGQPLLLVRLVLGGTVANRWRKLAVRSFERPSASLQGGRSLLPWGFRRPGDGCKESVCVPDQGFHRVQHLLMARGLPEVRRILARAIQSWVSAVH